MKHACEESYRERQPGSTLSWGEPAPKAEWMVRRFGGQHPYAARYDDQCVGLEKHSAVSTDTNWWSIGGQPGRQSSDRGPECGPYELKKGVEHRGFEPRTPCLPGKITCVVACRVVSLNLGRLRFRSRCVA